MPIRTALFAGIPFLFASFPIAHASDTYVAVSAGVSLANDSDNQGEFSADFLTGAGSTIPAGTILPTGTAVGWETQFDTGYAVNAALGRRFGAIRGEVEVAYQNNGVDTHTGVAAGGIALAGEDAGVLITGSPNIGVTVGDLVAAGEGSLETVFVMANAIYDFNSSGRLKPYIGAGVGVGFVDVDYSPSATPIIQDSATQFAFQALAGVSYEVTRSTEVFAGYRYRATSDVEVQADLFAADFEVENRASIIEAGLRFSF